MAVLPFIDTNVLIYVYSSAGSRTDRAEQLFLEGGVVSVQVLNEFASAARKKLGMQWWEVRTAIQRIIKTCPQPRSISVMTHEAALRICEQNRLSFYDGLIVAAALEAGCNTLYTEDLQHGQLIDGLLIENPFLA